jgi:hypothetical protein
MFQEDMLRGYFGRHFYARSHQRRRFFTSGDGSYLHHGPSVSGAFLGPFDIFVLKVFAVREYVEILMSLRTGIVIIEPNLSLDYVSCVSRGVVLVAWAQLCGTCLGVPWIHDSWGMVRGNIEYKSPYAVPANCS